MLPFDHTRVLPFPVPDYRRVHELQLELVAERGAGRTADVLLLGEHERVVTLGRGRAGELPALDLPVVPVERGGLATWHGPGQLVVYPIVDLRNVDLSVRAYLRALETACVEVLGTFGVTGTLHEGATGVWVGERKIVSIGVAVRRFVTYHGLALNVAPDLADFHRFEPCGFRPGVMTSLAELLREPPSMAEVTLRTVQALVRTLRLAPPIWERRDDTDDRAAEH